MTEIKITNPSRFCINCAFAFQRMEHGEYYCRLAPLGLHPVTGQERSQFCEIERANADRCGRDAVNFKPRSEP